MASLASNSSLDAGSSPSVLQAPEHVAGRPWRRHD